MTLQFKAYTWPQNPQTYREVLTREPLYVTRDGTTAYSGMSHTRRTISGSGAFFGEGAYDAFQQLILLAEDSTPGTLVHPEWGSRYCYLTKLEFDQEPREDFVSYRFEFLQARDDGTVPR